MKFCLSGFLFFYALAAVAALPFAPAEVGSSRQIILVESKGVNATVSIYVKDDNLWLRSLGPWPAVVGRQGAIASAEKREGDGHTPQGLYKIGFSFGYAPRSPAMWEYRQMSAEDKWIDDPQSADYNKLVRGKTDAKSFENMKRVDNQYEWGLVIEYNTRPVKPGRGSAIFLHIWRDSQTGTAGCVALAKENVVAILRALDSSRDPRILIR